MATKEHKMSWSSDEQLGVDPLIASAVESLAGPIEVKMPKDGSDLSAFEVPAQLPTIPATIPTSAEESEIVDRQRFATQALIGMGGKGRELLSHALETQALRMTVRTAVKAISNGKANFAPGEETVARQNAEKYLNDSPVEYEVISVAFDLWLKDDRCVTAWGYAMLTLEGNDRSAIVNAFGKKAEQMMLINALSAEKIGANFDEKHDADKAEAISYLKKSLTPLVLQIPENGTEIKSMLVALQSDNLAELTDGEITTPKGTLLMVHGNRIANFTLGDKILLNAELATLSTGTLTSKIKVLNTEDMLGMGQYLSKVSAVLDLERNVPVGEIKLNAMGSFDERAAEMLASLALEGMRRENLTIEEWMKKQYEDESPESHPMLHRVEELVRQKLDEEFEEQKSKETGAGQ